MAQNRPPKPARPVNAIPQSNTITLVNPAATNGVPQVVVTPGSPEEKMWRGKGYAPAGSKKAAPTAPTAPAVPASASASAPVAAPAAPAASNSAPAPAPAQPAAPEAPKSNGKPKPKGEPGIDPTK
jgi:hypothetical protein